MSAFCVSAKTDFFLYLIPSQIISDIAFCFLDSHFQSRAMYHSNKNFLINFQVPKTTQTFTLHPPPCTCPTSRPRWKRRTWSKPSSPRALTFKHSSFSPRIARWRSFSSQQLMMQSLHWSNCTTISWVRPAILESHSQNLLSKLSPVYTCSVVKHTEKV